MNLNPFELRDNDYMAKDMYKKTNFGGDLEPSLWNEEYGGYEYLLKGINTDIDWKVTCYTGSYQGELCCLGVDAAGKYYYVNTGYGSCSGCDWYEACGDSIVGLQELQDSLKNNLKEFDSLTDFIKWFTSPERKYNEWRSSEERDEFLKDVEEKYKVKVSNY